MILVDTKAEVTSSSVSGLKDSQDEPSVDFSKFLKQVGQKDGKVIQNGALVLSLDGEEKVVKTKKSVEKNDTLLSLLKNDDLDLKDTKEVLDINPKLVNTLSSNELKGLVSNAKNYLKTKITQSDDYKQLQIKELPKTLKGLVSLAEKIGIDVSKITLQDVQSKVEIKKAIKKVELKISSEVTKKNSIEKVQNTSLKEIDVEKELPREEKVPKRFEKIKNTPIFQTKSLVNEEQHTTQQLVEIKQFKEDKKTPKDKANETLKLLLNGEKPSSETKNLTADFSVETAKVIAPKATTESSKELESLLHDKTTSSKDNIINPKTEHNITAHKADSFEVKLNEAKQMVKHLSHDVKTAIEDYKSPFTRVKIQLNPQRFGEIDLTVVQRGKNLHVNLSSNNAAINTLSLNANELKTQLQNSGINNASLNFSNNSQSGEQAQHQQQNNAHKEYGYFDTEDENEEILNSLEIVVPNYA